MTRKLLSVMACMVMLFVTLSCQLFTSPNHTVTPSKATVSNSEATRPESTATADSAATASAAAVTAEAAATAGAKAAATEEEENTKATEAAKVQLATQTAAEKATLQVSRKIERTATAAGKATVQADGMYNLVKQLKSEGVLQSTAGRYYPVKDFKESWAQINWYQWWNSGYAPDDFVIRAHTAWESASKTANWFSAGCGFVFRAKNADNHYMIFLALDSNVYLHGYVDGKYREFGKGSAGKINHLKGEADVVLVAQGDRFVYYVNGVKALDRKNSDLAEGDLGLTLNSGTNKDFGTRCEMTGIELWDLSGH